MNIVCDEPILQFFKYKHLPEKLQIHSRPFAILAQEICQNLPNNPERSEALRKLLEAKDCAVRASLYIDITLKTEDFPWNQDDRN